jgi:hypothetical protein
MTTIGTAVPHMKMHGFSGDHLLERCEDAGCMVDERGTADCGRLACPSCGFSGSNVTGPDSLDGEALAQCSCGNAWVPEPELARAAA